MDVNFSAKKTQYVSNNSTKLPETKQEDTSMQTNQHSTPEITPDSAILRAYAGIIEPKKTVSKEEVINFLRESLIFKEHLYDKIIDSLTEKDGNIYKTSLNHAKNIFQKRYIGDISDIFNAAKENGKINYKAIEMAEEILPEREFKLNVYKQINITKVLNLLKNKDGKFDINALNFFAKHGKTLQHYLIMRHEERFFKALKNNNDEFSLNAFKYIDDLITEGGNTNTILVDLMSSKDKNGNFSFDIYNLNKELGSNFTFEQFKLVKPVVDEFTQEQAQERDNFIEFARSIAGEKEFSNIINFIRDNKNPSDNGTGLNYNTESLEFVKELLKSSYNNIERATKIYKTLNILPQEYTPELLESLEILYKIKDEDLELFLNASKNKTGDKKEQLNTENLNKYLEIYSKEKPISKDSTKKLISYLSLEDDNTALNIFHKIYLKEWEITSYMTETPDTEQLDLLLKLLCNYNPSTNTPRQKCPSKALEQLSEILTNPTSSSSKEEFSKAIDSLIKETIKEQYLKDTDTNILNVSLNSNINSVLEIQTGEKTHPAKILYDFSKGKIVSQTQEVRNDKIVTQIQEDYVNNTKTETSYEYIPIGAPISQSISKYDESGNLLYTQTIEKSPVENVYNVTKKYADGTEEKICNAYKTPEGNDVIEKHMTSLDGTKTDYRYEDDVLGNRIIDYKITDKNGKVLMNQSVTFEVVDENHFVSSRNNKKFDIKFNGTNLDVTNKQTNETVTIELNSFTNMTYEKLLPVLKSFPGDELFNMKKLDLKSFSVDESVDNACFNNHRKTIKTRESYIDLSVLLHEWGHAKDELEFSEINEKINNDPKLRQIYEQEREAFRKNLGDSQQSFVGYFCADSHYLGKDNSIVEGIAETNVLLSAYPKNNTQNMRSLYWQQYFPRTIAYLSGLLN